MIERPVFIVGSGRSGTTIFFKTLAKHKQVGYFSNYDDSFPRLFRYGITPFLESNNLTLSIIGKVKQVQPSMEIMGIMQYCGIRKKGIPLSDEDVKQSEARCLKQMIYKCLEYRKVSRFIAKNTNNGMRIEYLDKIFPNSIFIHVLRDGRANVNSYLNVPFFSKMSFWWWNNKKLENWINESRKAEELAALHWKHNVEEILKQAKCLPKDRYLEVKYEEFTEDPKRSFQKVVELCGLGWSRYFESVIENTQFKNMNYKWKKDLNLEQKEIVESIAADLLQKLGYI